MQRIAKALTLAALLAATLLPAAAMAHDAWVTAPAIAPGQTLTVVVGYGHAFPASEELDAALIEEPVILVDGATIATKPAGDMKFASAGPLAKGSYVVKTGRKAQFYTKSPAGNSNKPKDEVQDAISCIRTVKYAKAIVNVGGVVEAVSAPVGDPLEILPLANPGTIKVGGDLPVQVLQNGKPLPKAEVMATFAGFTADGKAMAFYARTDKDGKVNVKLWHSGLWLVRTAHKEPYKDQAKCDNFGQTAVLTFEIK